MSLPLFAAAKKNREANLLKDAINKAMTPLLPVVITRTANNAFDTYHHLGKFYFLKRKFSNPDGLDLPSTTIPTPLVKTCTTTSGSNTLTNLDVTGLSLGMAIIAPGVPTHATIASIGANSVTMELGYNNGSMLATATASNVTVIFGIPPYCWSRMDIIQNLSCIISKNPAVTRTGTSWAFVGTQNSTTAIGGGYWNGYTPNDTINCTYVGAGDVYIRYNSKPSGGIVKVEIDDDTEKCNLLPSNGSYRYIDTYSDATVYNIHLPVASNLPYGTHVIKVTITGSKNASATSTYAAISAFGVCQTADLAVTQASKWVSGSTYVAYDQIMTSAGWFYSCTTAGAGTCIVEPTHGSAGNSTVETDGYQWYYMGNAVTNSSYPVQQTTNIQMEPAKVEYAMETKPTGSTYRTQFGGTEHGHEVLLTFSLKVDDVEKGLMSIGAWETGNRIEMTQSTKCYNDDMGSTHVDAIILKHIFLPGSLEIKHDHVWNMNGGVGFNYSPMMGNLYWWTANENRYIFRKTTGAYLGSLYEADYNGSEWGNVLVGMKRDYQQIGYADLFIPKGSGGVPNADQTPLATGIYIISTDPVSMNNYKYSSTLCSLKPNDGGATVPGTTGVRAKMYFQRSEEGKEEAVNVGTVWNCKATYRILMTESPIPY